GDFVGSGINDGNSSGALVVGKDASSIRGHGNALNALRDGNGGDQLAIDEVQHADGASTNIGCVRAAAIGRENEHVRLGLAGRDFREHFASRRINYVDDVGEFGGYVQQVVGSKFREMRAKRLAQVNGRCDFVLLEIDHINGSAVGARLP